MRALTGISLSIGEFAFRYYAKRTSEVRSMVFQKISLVV